MNPPTGKMLPSADVLNDFEHGKFVLSNLAAKRATQLKQGAPPLVRIESNHPLTIALAEIAAGKIRAILGAEGPEISAFDGEVTLLEEGTVPAELGLLLPALDETEADLLGVAALTGEEDVEHDDDVEAEADGAPSLSDLLEDTEAEPESEPTPVEGEEDTLSLADLAEEEENASGEEALDE